MTALQILETTIHARGHSFPIVGSFAPRFQAVAAAFAENYRVEDEVGSALSVVVDGSPVVDLYGGYADAAMSKPWLDNTIVCMMSVAKGVSGITFNMLIDRGLIDIDAPVAAYWPEFGVAGKEHLPVRYVLDHRAGLPVVTDLSLPKGSIFDWNITTKALARQAPLWEPGTQAGYHIHTQGFLLGEIMRRVVGKGIAAYFRDEVARPLHLDYQIGGLSDSDQLRCADLIAPSEPTLFSARESSPISLRGLAFAQNPDEPMSVTVNSRAWREAEISSANGHGTATAVARLYGAIARGGEQDGVRLMSQNTIRSMIAEQHHLTEIVQSRPYRQALGVLLNTEDAVWMGPNPQAFGHHGFGGSIGMGDTDAKLGLCYAVNKMHTRTDNGPRGRRLIEAIYACL